MSTDRCLHYCQYNHDGSNSQFPIMVTPFRHTVVLMDTLQSMKIKAINTHKNHLIIGCISVQATWPSVMTDVSKQSDLKFKD